MPVMQRKAGKAWKRFQAASINRPQPTAGGGSYTKADPKGKASQACKAPQRRWEEVAARFEGQNAVRGVELGAWKGVGTRGLLAAMPTLQLTAIDAWDTGVVNDASKYCSLSADGWRAVELECRAAVEPFSGRINIRKTLTSDTADVPPGLDFVFVDADHSYEGCKSDIATWWPLVRPGGYICGHDYGAAPDSPYYKPGTTRAVDEFAAQVAEPITRGADHTWFIRKPSIQPVVVSFWYDAPGSGTYFQESAKRLIKSCERLGLAHMVEHAEPAIPAGIPAAEAWRAATRHKPSTILAALNQLPPDVPVLWVDADYIFEQKPVIDCKLGAAAYTPPGKTWPRKPVTYSGAFVWFGDRELSRSVVARWQDEMLRGGHDHYVLDSLLAQNNATVLDAAWCWRGKHGSGYGAKGKTRKHVNKAAVEDAAVVTAMFGTELQPIFDAHIASVQTNMPGAEFVIVEPGAAQQPAHALPHYAAPNHHKLRVWRDTVRHLIGSNLILLDGDTVVTRDMRERFNAKFDLCFTEKDTDKSINGGVVFVRCSEKTAAFFDRWYEHDTAIFNNKALFLATQKHMRGQNQASLGKLLHEDGDMGCSIARVPCRIWNSVNPYWGSFDPDVCYLLHLKDGSANNQLRQFVLGNPKARFDPGKHAAAVETWNLWAPPGHLRKV